MKIFKLLILCFLFIQSHSLCAAQALVSELKIFEPYLGTWQADFPVVGGKPAMQDVSHWERALNGTAVRTLHSINEGMYGGESLIFWDKTKKKVVFFYFTTAGFYTQGTMDVLDDGSFVAYEDVAGNQDGITKVKSTSRFVDGEMEVSTQYLKHGMWTEPEKRRYTRSNKAVKFH
ncbi:hypothetical protein [Pseudoalteromonas sp. MMG022]|uniref:hypothetical protein n=1 Tax=Pseudoalteromonas sp. MMG022 TaxID=2909978 RepID=UPI001F33CAB6|nr:hypothetical protein [Pseudoalteromonas sp. MMG022]MCF6437689.1 hypothetical protein [Pseudoalteromonas sp. MMG022]